MERGRRGVKIEKYTKCKEHREDIKFKREEAIDSKLGSVSCPRCSSFNGRFMFIWSSITYERRVGGKGPEQ